MCVLYKCIYVAVVLCMNYLCESDAYGVHLHMHTAMLVHVCVTFWQVSHCLHNLLTTSAILLDSDYRPMEAF